MAMISLESGAVGSHRCAAFVGVLAAANAWAQVALSPGLEVGRRDRYAFQATFRESVRGGVETLTAQEGVVRLSVVRVVSGEGATVRLAFEEFHASIRRGDGPPLTFGWTEAGGEAPPGADAPQPPDDLAAVATAWGALTRSTLEFEAARDGEVSSVNGLQEAWGAAGPADLRFLGLFAPNAVETRLESLIRVDSGLPARVRSPGDSWEVVNAPALADRARAETTTTYSLAGASTAGAEIDGLVAVRLVLPRRDFDPADFRPVLEGQSGQVRVVWDPQRGRLVSRFEERSLTLGVTIDGGLASTSVTNSGGVKWTFLGEVGAPADEP